MSAIFVGKDISMSRSTRDGESLSRRASLSSVFSLTLWQLRRSKGLFGLIFLGILVAVTFVCATPLYTNIAMTAGLQDTIRTSSIIFSGQDAFPSQNNIASLSSAIDTTDQMEQLKPYLDSSSQHMTIETGLLSYY